MRDEYIYPNLRVSVNSKSKSTVLKNVSVYKAEYLSGFKSIIKPYGYEYFPAWLSLFSFVKNLKNKNISDMHKNGVLLDLHIDELESLTSDGTYLEFIPSSEFIKVSPDKISIDKVLTAPKKKKYQGTKVVSYYHLSKTILVKCSGGFLNKNEEIRVFAKKNDVRVEVGKIILYKNNDVRDLDVILVPIVHEYKNGKPIIPKYIKNYEHFFKRQSFNQALIRANVKVSPVLDIVKLADEQIKQKKNWDVKMFLLKFKTDTEIVDPATEKVGTRSNFSIEEIKSELIRIYNNYIDKSANINGFNYKNGKYYRSDANKKTYIFLLDHQNHFLDREDAVAGSATKAGQFWGDMALLFRNGLNSPSTYVHECAHTLGLYHSFDGVYSSNKIDYYQGFTDNFMDYSWGALGKNPNYSDNLGSFFYWQWGEMRKDRSLK